MKKDRQKMKAWPKDKEIPGKHVASPAFFTEDILTYDRRKNMGINNKSNDG